MINMRIYGSDRAGWHIEATVPGVRNPSGTSAVWVEDTAPRSRMDLTPANPLPDMSGLQNALNRLASNVQASKPFPKW